MNFLYDLLANLNYTTIFILMLVESTAIPFPSEVVVPPAAYFAAGGGLNFWLIILVATLGAGAGAAINYAAAYWLGRPIMYRFANSRLGHLCLLSEEKLQQAERYFDRHGALATLTGRLVPAVRQLISIPAGLAKMNFWRFLFYTMLGAASWNFILASLGWWLHSFVPQSELQDKINEYSEHIKVVILGLLALAIIYFMARHYIKKREKDEL